MYIDTDMTIEEKHDFYLEKYKQTQKDVIICIIGIYSFFGLMWLFAFLELRFLSFDSFMNVFVMIFVLLYFISKRDKFRQKQLELLNLYNKNIGSNEEEYW